MIGVLRTIFMALDVAVYWCVEVLLQLIMDLSNVEIFANSVIDEFSSRIYLILGLVMLFKLMLSFIQLLINPDNNSKENGVGNILKRVVISLALIFLVPSIFDLARLIQVEVIPVIPKVILGVSFEPEEGETDQGKIEEIMERSASLMAFYAYRPFFTYQNETCNDSSILGTSNDDGGNLAIWSVTTAFQNRHTEDVCSDDPDGYKYSYTFLIPTVVGAYLVFVLVTIAVEVAIRAIKLGVCELLAPIPISSYVDPKSSKQTFDKWVSISIKTYLDLFIRLILIYFVIFIFVTVFNEENLSIILLNVGDNFGRQGLVIVFIIVGLLQFIKQAPKFLSDMLGLSTGGNLMGMFKGDGFKAFGEAAGIPGTAAAAVGAGIQNTKNSWANSRFKESEGKSWWKRAALGVASGANALRRGAGGVLAATGRGAVATYKGQGWKGAYTKNLETTVDKSLKRVVEAKATRDVNNKLNADVTTASNDVSAHRTKAQEYRDKMDVNGDYEGDLNNARTTLSQVTSKRDRALGRLRSAEQVMQPYIDKYNAALKEKNIVQQYQHAKEEFKNAETRQGELLTALKRAQDRGDTEKVESLRSDLFKVNQKMRDAQTARDGIEAKYSSTYDLNQTMKQLHDKEEASYKNVRNYKESLGINQLQAEYDAALQEYNIANSEVGRLEELKVNYDIEINAMQTAEKVLEEAKETRRKDRIIPVVTDIKMGLSEFVGDSTAKGKDFVDLASHLRERKKTVLQGEAFSKIEKNISEVNKYLGEKIGDKNAVFTFKFKDKSNPIKAAFEDLVEAKAKFAAGANTVEIDVFDSQGNKSKKTISSTQFTEYFEDAQKTVGSAYTTAASKGIISNSAIETAMKLEIEDIMKRNIPNSLKAAMVEEVRTNFGEYWKKAGDEADKYEVKGKTLLSYERAVSDKKNG